VVVEDLVLRLRGEVVGGSIAGLITVLVGATAAVAAFVRTEAASITEQKRYAESIKATTAEIQSLKFAVETFGGDFPDVADAINTITDRVEDAKSGMQSYIDDLKLIDVEVSQLKANSPVELFEEVVEAFGETEDASKRTTAAVRLFGDDLGRKLLPLLTRGGAELARLRQLADELGLTVGEDAAEGAEEFTVRLGLLEARASAVAQAIGVRFLPVGLRVLDWLEAAADTALPVVLRAIKRSAEAAEGGLAFLETPLGRVVTLFALLTGAGGIARLLFLLTQLASRLPVVGAVFAALAGPVGLALLGLGALLLAAEDLYTFLTSDDPTESVIGRFTEWAGITDEVKTAITLLGDVATNTSELLGTLFDNLTDPPEWLLRFLEIPLQTIAPDFVRGAQAGSRAVTRTDNLEDAPGALLSGAARSFVESQLRNVALGAVLTQRLTDGPRVVNETRRLDGSITVDVRGQDGPAAVDTVKRAVREVLDEEATAAMLDTGG
jgi:hypothetical protein